MRIVGVILGMLLVILGVGYLLAPDLIADFQRRHDDFVPTADIRMDEAECRTYLVVVLSSCEVKMSGPSLADGSVRQRSFVFGRVEGVLVRALRSQTEPEFITTSFAQDNLWNRLLVFLSLEALLIVPLTVVLVRLFLGLPVPAPRKPTGRAR